MGYPTSNVGAILARIDDLLGRGRELAERYAASDDARRAQLGAILRAVLATPAETEIYLVEGKPAITGWGFAPDRPWDAPDGSVRRPNPPAGPTGSVRDVVVPEVAIPELVTAPRARCAHPIPRRSRTTGQIPRRRRYLNRQWKRPNRRPCRPRPRQNSQN